MPCFTIETTYRIPVYRQLEREYEYQTSDAVVDESIIANDYTFTEAGRRFG